MGTTCLHRRRRVLRARYVFPVTSPPIAHGTVAIDGVRIGELGCKAAGAELEDLGNVAILPGLVNAHTHLEFSDLAAPLGEPGMGFVDWLRLVVESRRRAAAKNSPVGLGLEESARLGTTALGEIAQPGWPLEQTERANLDTTVFLELIAPTAARIPAALALAQEHLKAAALGAGLPTPPENQPGDCPDFRGLRRAQPSGATDVTDRTDVVAAKMGLSPFETPFETPGTNWRPGLSPHAPYSVHPELLARVVSLSAEHRVPLAMHLAESREELDLLHSGSGPLRKRLEELDAWEPGAIPRGTRPLDYLRALAAAHWALIIHGNYLDDEEITFLAAHAERMAVVYCPRTHAFFRHAPYPLEKMLSAGVTVALGTDGRASSPDLSVLAEMRVAAEKHTAVGGDALLKMATLHGAAALGLERELGSLEPGKYADLAVVALPDRTAADPHDLLLQSAQPVVATWRRGVEVARVGQPSQADA